MEHYLNILETWIQQERKLITYRFLSRHLGIHVNYAKQILFDFYKICQEKGKKCHAIYIISGFRTEEMDNYSLMLQENMPLMDNASDTHKMSWEPIALKVKDFYLVKEENVEEVKKNLNEITSIHVYALEFDSYMDSSVLSDAFMNVYHYIKYEETLSLEEICKKYGMIHNLNITSFPVAPQLFNIETLQSKSTNVSKTDLSHTTTFPSEKEKKQKSMVQNSSEDTKHNTKLLSKFDNKNVLNVTKKKSNTMESFFGLNSNVESKNTLTCPSNSVVLCKNNDYMFVILIKNLAGNSHETEEKHDEDIIIKRQQEIDLLKTIMNNQEKKDDVNICKNDILKDDNMDRSIKIDQVDSDKKKRGRRKVLKKVTSLDKKGYLVTKNEFVWESFSEDETSIPKKTKPDLTFKDAFGKTKIKSSETKITSFFSKK